MLQQQPSNIYFETKVLTATPAQLLIMLCDGAIRFSKQGIEAMKSNRYEDANYYICRAQAIINEFIITIDRSSAISDSLLRLYEYFNHLLIQGNVKKQAEPIEEVLGYLFDLKETWLQAAKLAQSGNAGAGANHGTVV